MTQHSLQLKIKSLQEEIIQLFSIKGSLTDEDVVSKSQELDKLILAYTKLAIRKEC